jgi:hypothetical protein
VTLQECCETPAAPESSHLQRTAEDCGGQGLDIGKDYMAFDAVSNIENALNSLDSYRGPSEEWDFSEVGLGSL